MNKEIVSKYGQIVADYAEACYHTKSNDDLENQNDLNIVTDCKKWGITPQQWSDAMQIALKETVRDLADGQATQPGLATLDKITGDRHGQ